MKRAFIGLFLAFALIFAAAPAYAATIKVQIDGVTLPQSVAPQIVNNRAFMPLRTIAEDLCATVAWQSGQITLTKDDTTVVLKSGSKNAQVNGQTVQLEAKPYLRQNLTYVPLRFLTQSFSCQVGYSDKTVMIATTPLKINGRTVAALQREYNMTMGGVITQFKGNAYLNSIYDLFIKNKVATAQEPAYYSWQALIDNPGAYYKNGQYDFLDASGNSIQRFDIYILLHAFPEEELQSYPQALLYDATTDQWYLFTTGVNITIFELTQRADMNGFGTLISNTVV